MLEICNLGVRYGRHLALENVSAKIGKGEIVVMLGANGAGKSSLLKAIAGLVPTEPGTGILMSGKPIRGMKAHRIVEEGIALVPEGRGIFGDLTVAENLQLGAFAARARGDEATTLKRIYELFPRLAERKGQVARTMSGGEQQMVAIGRALMSKPEILMLDEPSLGLSPLLSKELFKSLKAVAATGLGILLVEQNARLSLKIADRGYLVENGLITGEDSAVNLMNDPAVANAYLGGKAATGDERKARRGIALPPFFGLQSGLAGITRAVADLARRAGAIQQAFTRHLRRAAPPPSAFAGRYDPKSGPDPWEEVAAIGRAVEKRQAARTEAAVDTAAMAARAQDRLRRHLDAGRLRRRRDAPPAAPAPEPAAFLPSGRAARRNVATIDAADLAARAHDRLRNHVDAARSARHRQAAPEATKTTSSSGARREEPGIDAAGLAARAGERLAAHLATRRAGKPAAPQSPLFAHGASDGGWLGHNSAGIDIDAEDGDPVPRARRDGIGDLAARAAEIHAAHVARGRQKLAIFTFSANRPGNVAAGSTRDAPSAGPDTQKET